MKNAGSILPYNLTAITAEYCRRNFSNFVKELWDTVIAEEMVWSPHMQFLCDDMQQIAERTFLKSRGVDEAGKPLPPSRLPKEYDYIIYNVPPGSSKSTIASQMYPLWVWTNDATQRFICGSYASTVSEDIAGKCFKIYNSEKFRAMYPHLHGKKSRGGKTHFENGLLGERYTTSTGSTITGIHAHQKIIDDPMTPAIAVSKVERESANRWLSETISSRNVSHTVTVTFVIMQRLHENDTTGYLLKKEKEDGLKIRHVCLPVEITAETEKDVKPVEALLLYSEDGLLDPIRRPLESLPAVKRELGSYGYAGQMLQKPAPPEGGIIKKHWFQVIARSSPHASASIKHFQFDTAYTAKTTNDPTGGFSYYLEDNKIFIVNFTRVYKEMPDLLRWFPPWLEENGYWTGSKVYVEPKANGKSVVQTMIAGTQIDMIESEPPTEDKLTGLVNCSPKIEAGRVVLHEGPWNADFIEEVCSFPNAEHDEAVDILVATIKRELGTDYNIDPAELANFFQ